MNQVFTLRHSSKMCIFSLLCIEFAWIHALPSFELITHPNASEGDVDLLEFPPLAGELVFYLPSLWTVLHSACTSIACTSAGFSKTLRFSALCTLNFKQPPLFEVHEFNFVSLPVILLIQKQIFSGSFLHKVVEVQPLPFQHSKTRVTD